MRRAAAIGWAAANVYASYRLAPAGVDRSRLHRRNARRLVRVIVEQQGLLVKVGQSLATRADVLPDEYVEELSRLHDRVPPRPFREISPHLERSLGRSLADVFRSFERTPIAAASLAQVHEAVLWDGRRVAVKIQYPDIATIIADDVRNLRLLLRALAVVDRNVDLKPLLEEIARSVRNELDFVAEGRNAEGIGALFAGRDDVVVPTIVHELSRPKLLVMEFLDGIKVTDVARLDAAGIDRRALAEQLIRTYAEQILVHGFFHADPHPGNVFVQPRVGAPPRLVLLDFGLVKRLPEPFRASLAATLLAILRGRPVEMLAELGRLGFRTRKGTYDDLVPLTKAMLEFAGRRPEEIVSEAEVVDRFGREVLRAYRDNPIVEIPDDVLLVMRVLGILGGVARQLSTHVNLVELLMPYAREGVSARPT